jgi:isopentenyl diphosphate isomerase/L-lactate dehydrogenase-like FMN-dependent dehydrogenase
MPDYWTLHELVAEARRLLCPAEWDFIVGGAETETTLSRNRRALDSLALRQRVLGDVSQVKFGKTLLGRQLRLPVIIAPIGKQTYGGGPIAAAEAARDYGCGYMLSSVNQQASAEDVAATGDDWSRIYQIYVRGDDAWLKQQVERAVGLGYSAVALTVDTAVVSRRERDHVNRYASYHRRRFEGEAYQAGFNWDKLRAVRAYCDLPLIVKGIGTPEDAAIAADLGVDVIYVSNHGGRQLDHAIASIDMLPEIADAVGGRAEIVVDGGILRGSDIVKAVALGASAVGLGKLHCLALAANGREGVVRMLEILQDEVEICLSLIGVADINDLNPACVQRVAPVERGNDFAHAFPLLEA